MHGDLIISPSIEDLRTEKEIFFIPLLYHQNDDPDSSMSVGLALCPEMGSTDAIGRLVEYKRMDFGF